MCACVCKEGFSLDDSAVCNGRDVSGVAKSILCELDVAPPGVQGAFRKFRQTSETCACSCEIPATVRGSMLIEKAVGICILHTVAAPAVDVICMLKHDMHSDDGANAGDADSDGSDLESSTRCDNKL